MRVSDATAGTCGCRPSLSAYFGVPHIVGGWRSGPSGSNPLPSRSLLVFPHPSELLLEGFLHLGQCRVILKHVHTLVLPDRKFNILGPLSARICMLVRRTERPNSGVGGAPQLVSRGATDSSGGGNWRVCVVLCPEERVPSVRLETGGGTICVNPPCVVLIPSTKTQVSLSVREACRTGGGGLSRYRPARPCVIASKASSLDEPCSET